MSCFLVGCLANSLHCQSNSVHSTFKKVILYACRVCEFYMYCQYPTHDTISLNSIEASLSCFHDNKDVFIENWVSKKNRC